MQKTFSIIFHTKEDFEKALSMTKTLVPDYISASELEMTWNDEWWRYQAVHELDEVDITVDTYEL